MKQRVVMAMVVVEVMLLTTGRQSMFISNQTTMLSRWKTWPAGVQLYVEARQGNCTYLVEIENLVSSPMLACES